MLLLCFFCAAAISAQKSVLKGAIQDTAQQPISGIIIQLQGTRLQTLTDQSGNFSFTQIPAGNYTIVASGIGYVASKQNISIGEGQTYQIYLRLDVLHRTLTEVTVLSRIGKEKVNALTRNNTALRDLPQGVQSVDRNVLNDQQAFSFDEALKNVAGLTATDFYGGFSSRGFTTSASAITTNGIVGSPYPEGQLALLGNIEKVEVIHGPSASLNGPGALGGNINLVTKQPKKYTAINSSVSGGSFNLFRVQADVTGSLTKNKKLYFLAGTGLQNGGKFTRDYNYRSFQLYGSVKWEIAKSASWQVNFNYINDDASNNYQPRVPIYNTRNTDSMFLVPYTFSPGKDSYYKGNNIQIQSLFDQSLGKNWKMGLLLAYNEGRAERAQYTASGFVSLADNTVIRSYSWQKIYSPKTTVNLYATGKVKTGAVIHNLTIGGDLMDSYSNYPDGLLQYAAKKINVYSGADDPHYDSTGMTMYYNTRIERFKYNTLGAYIMDHVEITPKLKVLASLRLNNYHRTYFAIRQDGTLQNDEKPLDTKNLSPRFGIVYQPVRTVSVYADYNEGFIPHSGNYAEYGGPFEPETSKQYEVGFKGDFFQGNFQPFLSIYQLTKWNVLQASPTPTQPNRQEAIGAVRSRGVEMGIKGSLLSNLYVTLNYNYNMTMITEAKKPEDIGQRFANTPTSSANGWFKYSFNNTIFKGLFAGGGFQYVGSRFFSNVKTNNLTPLVMPEYTVFDAFLGYRIRQYALQVNANNLADKRYAASGISNSYTPGMPRNIIVTFSCSFR
ncbi:TonB-dependent Receptor Plug Domain [Sediminibacterium ginsengisoli]|uniref:TonB-dependent Receptor Plug Domain n=2 Tax=Sediminibacterium ginsengisoli TaxID=413434 RepID=A0A1T4PQD9_9BACT|nr:TonB-dependent Receptor Plug Domain [Sediminibacterium ginsengisoli]